MRADYLHILFGILLKEIFVFSLINLLNHLFISVWTYGYFFSILYCSPKLGLLSVGLCVSSICFHQCRGVVCVLSTPLLPGTIRISRHTFMSCLSTRIIHFSKDPWFFLLENGVRGQDRMLSMIMSLVCHCC